MSTKQKWYRVHELEVEQFDPDAEEWPEEVVDLRLYGTLFVIATPEGSESIQPGDFVVRDLTEGRFCKMTPAEFDEFRAQLYPCIWTPIRGGVSSILAASLRMEPKPDNQAWAICYTEEPDAVILASQTMGVL